MIWGITRHVLMRKIEKKPLSPTERGEIQVGVDFFVKNLYSQCRHRTAEQRQQSLFSIARKMGFESTNYDQVCSFLDDQFGLEESDKKVQPP